MINNAYKRIKFFSYFLLHFAENNIIWLDMIKIREYKSRKAADKASSYLMSKGIPAVIKGYVVVPKALEHLKDGMVELTVPEHLCSKAREYLSEYESRIENDSKK